MNVISPYTGTEGGPILGYLFHCPGCGHSHAYTTHASQKLVWTFNGDLEKPTFSPSLLNWKGQASKRCHLFVRDGKIQFLSDCFHEFAGKTLPMEPVES